MVTCPSWGYFRRHGLGSAKLRGMNVLPQAPRSVLGFLLLVYAPACLEEPNEGPPALQHDESLDFLERIAEESPPEDEYEFIGYVSIEGEEEWIHDEPPQGTVQEVLAAAGFDTANPFHDVEVPQELKGLDAGRGILVSADGRLFLERTSAFAARLKKASQMPDEGVSLSPSSGTALGPVHANSTLGSVLDPLNDGIHGSDQRAPVTSASYPTRATGVLALSRTGSGNHWAGPVPWIRRGSATMVGPRAVLTNAHVMLNGNSNPRVTGFGPAARGFSWSSDPDPGPGRANSKFPYGIRRTSWYYWPSGFDGGVKYDYAIAILEDFNWSPGHIRIGYQGTSWLDFKNGWTARGYPGGSCANSFDGDGACGGYMYSILGQTRGAYTNYVEHWLDTKPGQSGSGMYITNGNDRVLYLINTGECSGARDCGYAKRLRSGSYSTICSWVNSFPSSHFPPPDCD